MKIHAILSRWILPILLLGLFVTACGCQENPDKTGNDPLPGSILGQDGNFPEVRDGSTGPMVGDSGPDVKVNDYEVGLDVNKRIILGRKRHVSVWIAPKDRIPELQEGKARNTATVPAKEMKSYARITLVASECKIDDPNPQVTGISESGASVPFSVTPEIVGATDISAKVELSDKEDFQEAPYTWTETVTVTVYVDGWEIIRAHLRKIGEFTLDKLTVFLSALVALVLGMALYVIRKYLKQKTGYDQKKHGGEIDGQ